MKFAKVASTPELIYGFILLLAFYYQPRVIQEYSNTVLGKLFFVLFILVSGLMYGKYVAILASLVVVLFMHSYYEGFEDGNSGEASSEPTTMEMEEQQADEMDGDGDEKEDENAKDVSEGEGESGDGDGDEQSIPITGADVISNEELMKPKNSKEIDISQISNGGMNTQEQQPEPEPVDSTKSIEAFANYN